MDDVTVELLPIPATLDAGCASDFEQSVKVGNAVEGHLWGHEDFTLEAAERIVMVQPSPDREHLLSVARSGGRIVATARASLPLRDNVETAYLQIDVLPEHRRRGIATALLRFVEGHLRERARSTIMSWSDARADAGGLGAGVGGVPDLAPPTGAGGYPAADGAARFALGHGFELVQVDRQSVLHLAAVRSGGGRAALRGQESAARAKAAGTYELVQWADRCPEGLVEDYSLLRRRMSTDPPLGGFVQQEELWDEGRVRREEARSLAAGTSTLVQAVRHRASGQLVGHTILERFDARPAVVYQEDTLVLDDHRGHRLGMWLKATNLLLAADVWGSADRIYTWNAEENSFMPKVNEALGFRPSGRTAGWQQVSPAVDLDRPVRVT
ncbi:GNAT family N-acetyltransferase [Arthrobacter agilis]|uniref:GNAT family N-acetyltransferase n=1 Tax=Arthrobacter agilis TaxID=37921 RepID=UPI002366E44B|nr:GNAT family N-acetyltransferase [Arthrobacter agilis]WDF32684.1 GNAT family N-acetyltransferase [Arthrobacter agilis]